MLWVVPDRAALAHVPAPRIHCGTLAMGAGVSMVLVAPLGLGLLGVILVIAGFGSRLIDRPHG